MRLLALTFGCVALLGASEFDRMTDIELVTEKIDRERTLAMINSFELKSLFGGEFKVYDGGARPRGIRPRDHLGYRA